MGPRPQSWLGDTGVHMTLRSHHFLPGLNTLQSSLTRPFPLSLGLQPPVNFPVYCTPEAGLDLALLGLVPKRTVRFHVQPRAPGPGSGGERGLHPTARPDSRPCFLPTLPLSFKSLPASPVGQQPYLAVLPVGSCPHTPLRQQRRGRLLSWACPQAVMGCLPALAHEAKTQCPGPRRGWAQGALSKCSLSLNLNQTSQSLEP